MGTFQSQYQDRWPWFDFLIRFFGHSLPSVCVPCFFLISGFLMFNQSIFSTSIYQKKLKSRYHSLLVPYLTWNFIGFLIFLVKMHPALSSHFPSLNGFRVDIEVFLMSFWDTNLPKDMNIGGPIDFPLWYVRDLILLVLASPIIYWLIRKLKSVFVVLMGIVWFFNLQLSIGIPLLSGQSLFFFPLGAYFAINRVDFVEIAKKAWWAPFAFFIIAPVGAMVWSEPVCNLLPKAIIIIGCIAVFRMASYFLEKKQVKINTFLSNSSFFVFALHGLLITKMMNIAIKVVPSDAPGMGLLLFFVVPAITIVICLITYKLLLKLPSVVKVLSGGR